MEHTKTETKTAISKKDGVVKVVTTETVTKTTPGKEPEVKVNKKVDTYEGDALKNLPADLKKQLDEMENQKVDPKLINKKCHDDKFSENVLEKINKYRKSHGAEPLKESSKVTAYAKERAEAMAAKDEMLPREGHKYGECVSGLWSNDPNSKVDYEDVCKRWYDEVKLHKFGEEPTGALKSGNFTQMVWKDSKKFGVAAAKSNTNKIYVVAAYDPPGNWVGEFKEKVSPAKPGIGSVIKSFVSGKSRDASSSESSDDDKGSDSLADFNKKGVTVHNDYRKLHGAPPVKYSAEMGDADLGSGVNGCGNLQAVSPTPMSFSIIGNGEELLVDPSLQPFISLNGSKPLGLMQNNNQTETIFNEHHLDTSLDASESYMVQERDSNAAEIHLPKKLCPLEMSIKAADLDLEFEKDYIKYNIEHTNGLGPFAIKNSCADPMVLSPFKTDISATFLNAEPNDAIYTGTMTQPSQPLTLTLQSAPVLASGQQVLLLQVQPQIQDPVVPAQPVTVAPPPLLLPPQPIAIPLSMSTCVRSLSPTSPVLAPLSPTLGSPVPTVPSFQHTKITREESEPSADETSHMESLICEVDESGDSLSTLSEDEVKEPEKKDMQALVLKIRKVAPKRRRINSQSAGTWKTELEKGKERWMQVKESQVRKKRGRNRIEYSPEEIGWSASDDETLAKVVKQRREDEDYENDKESFRRAPKCCLRCCHVRIQPKYQEIAFREFRDLEKRNMGDCYLANCITLEPKKLAPDSCQDADKHNISSDVCSSEVDELVSREIANESNGNQSLSDEIENAIRESLKDQETADKICKKAESKEDSKCGDVLVDGAPWAFYLVINNRLRAACLKLLLSVLRIPQSRVEAIQRKIIIGEPLDRMPVLTKFKKASGVWPIAKRHLETLATTEVPYCVARPPHKRFLEPMTRSELFDQFREYYLKGTGNVLTTRFDTYRRLLTANANIAFPRKDETTCAGCECIEDQAPYHGNSGVKGRASKKNNAEDDPSAEKPLKPPRRRGIPSELSGANGMANQPSKVKARRRTGDAIMNGEKKAKVGDVLKKEKVVRKRPPKKGPRGDVLSLMIVHLKTVPFTKPAGCIDSQGHKFFDPASCSPQTLYEDYRKFFLKETNSELGLRYQLYESLLLRNRCFSIADFDKNSPECPRCTASPPLVTPLTKNPKRKNSNSVKR